MKATDYAQVLGLVPETLSRIENGKQSISIQIQKLAKLSYCFFSEDPHLSECGKLILQSILEEIKSKQQKKIVLEVDINQEWRELKAA